MFTLEITESAERDLADITDYLGVQLANPPAAVALLDEIDSVGTALEVNPELFPLCRDSHLADLGYRKALVKAYVMIYDIDAVCGVVRILRFFHTSEDYVKKL